MGRRYDPPYIPIRDIAPLQARESINKLLDVITNDMPLLRGAAAYWGAFVRAAPERETQLRRSYMAAASGGGVIYDDMRLRPQEIPVAFKLQLPKEAPLLPYIVASVGYGDEHLGHHGWKMGLAQVKWAEFVADVKRLEVLVHTQSYISDIRAAALVFYLCHPKRNAPLSKFSGLVVELYAKGRAIWYLRGITLMLEHMLGSEEHLEAKKVTGQLLELTRDDYAARWQIQQMLAKWRERSGAPLSHAGLAESWLMQG